MVMHDAGGRYDAWLNPLAWLEAEAGFPNAEHQPTFENALGFLCAVGMDRDVSSLVARYREIHRPDAPIFAPPSEPKILGRLIWPLRHAKASYVLGNYLGTIALCGLVCEMAAVLLFDVNPFTIDVRGERRRMSEADQRSLFGSTFERLGQDRRTAALRAMGVIDDELRQLMDSVRKTRRQYLHLLSNGDDRLAADAMQTFHNAVKVVSRTIGQGYEAGTIKLRPEILRYLVERGAATVGEQLPGDPNAQEEK